MKSITYILQAALCAFAVAQSAEAASPTAISPGMVDRFSTSANTCPLFTWAAVDNTESFELRIIPISSGTSSKLTGKQAAYQVHLPGGARAWQPPLGQCLEYGGKFTWSIRDTSMVWSEAMKFQIVQQPGADAIEQATEVLETWLRATSGEFEQKLEARPGGPLPQFTIAPDVTAITTMGTTSGGPEVTFGIHGISQSTTADSAGAVGEAQALTGNVGGIIGQVASPDGTAGTFENTGGGLILETREATTVGLRIDGSGNVFAPSYTGKGTALTGVTNLECSECVDSGDIIDGSITYFDLATGSVGQAKILADAVGTVELATDAVEAAEIAADAVTADKIVTDAVTAIKLADGAVGSSEIALGAVTDIKIKSNTLTRSNFDGLEKMLYSTHTDCDDAEKASLNAQCDSSLCQISPNKFLNCSGSCTANAPASCNNDEGGWLLDPAMDL